MLRQHIPDAVAGNECQRRRQIVAPEQFRPVGIELGSNVVIDRRSDSNRSTHLPRARRRRRSRSSSGTRLIVSDDSRESGTICSLSAWHSISSALGSVGRRLPSRSLASGVEGFAMSTTVADTTDEGRRPTTPCVPKI